MATDQMQILPTKPYYLVMNWHALGLSCFPRHTFKLATAAFGTRHD